MDAGNVEFAREMVAAFGEDRFYHAVMRRGSQHVRLPPMSSHKREAKQIFLALGGSEHTWADKCAELKLNPFAEVREDYRETEMDSEEARSVLCRAAFTIAKNHKEYARKKPEMPANIHARMILDSQNEWTRRYAEVLEEFEK